MFTSKQGREVNRLVKGECANYFDGDCLILDCNCPQLISDSVICRYFESSVLPLNLELEQELIGNAHYIHCKRCHNKFASRTPNTLYCNKCKDIVNREKTRERVRNSRNTKT